MDRVSVPRIPAEWAAIVPNHRDRELAHAWRYQNSPDYKADWLAAASRIAEYERCVGMLAAHLFDCEWHTQKNVRGGKPECIAEARRIMGLEAPDAR